MVVIGVGGVGMDPGEKREYGGRGNKVRVGEHSSIQRKQLQLVNRVDD